MKRFHVSWTKIKLPSYGLANQNQMKTGMHWSLWSTNYGLRAMWFDNDKKHAMHIIWKSDFYIYEKKLHKRWWWWCIENFNVTHATIFNLSFCEYSTDAIANELWNEKSQLHSFKGTKFHTTFLAFFSNFWLTSFQLSAENSFYSFFDNMINHINILQ